MVRLLVIDDHDVVRQGLVSALGAHGFTLIETAATIKQARAKIAAFNPQAVIVDLNLPDGSGFEVVQWVRKSAPDAAIIILSLNEPSQYVSIARSSGANAYLSKSQSIEEIVTTLNFALMNPRSFTSTLNTRHDHTVVLTPREVDVLHLMAKGASNSEISANLYISTSTVKTHISSILRKFDCGNRSTAIMKAREKGLLL
jgi:DNA-binding NarL/FixJ family response regulator